MQAPAITEDDGSCEHRDVVTPAADSSVYTFTFSFAGLWTCYYHGRKWTHILYTHSNTQAAQNTRGITPLETPTDIHQEVGRIVVFMT